MITIRNIRKSFGDNHVLKGINLDVHKGQVVVILGPSGSGKSTFLRCLNFLEKADEGTISIDGHEINVMHAKKADIVRHQRMMSMVFQNYALFENKTAKQNIAMPLVLARGKTKIEADKIAREMLIKVGLEDRSDFYPNQMSGGQQQRVGIARAMALDPEVMLFDEPTSALDPELVGQTLEVIEKIARSGATMILVTHEMQFAYDVADKIVFMDNGNVVETGTPDEVFNHPEKARTKEFLARYMRGIA